MGKRISFFLLSYLGNTVLLSDIIARQFGLLGMCTAYTLVHMYAYRDTQTPALFTPQNARRGVA